MSRIRKLLYSVLSIPNTLYFNFASFPFREAIKMPFFIGFNVKIIETRKGVVSFPNGVKPFLVRFGAGGSPSLPTQKSSIRIRGGKLDFSGPAYFGSGNILNINGVIVLLR